MHCSRCHGLMRKDYVLDMEAGFGEMWAQTWRCMNCGAAHDAVIAQNRLAGEQTVSMAVSGEPATHDDETYLGAEAFIRPVALEASVRTRWK